MLSLNSFILYCSLLIHSSLLTPHSGHLLLVGVTIAQQHRVLPDYWPGMLPTASGHFYLEIKIYIDNYLALINLPYGLNVHQVLMVIIQTSFLDKHSLIIFIDYQMSLTGAWTYATLKFHSYFL